MFRNISLKKNCADITKLLTMDQREFHNANEHHLKLVVSFQILIIKNVASPSYYSLLFLS